MADLFWFSDAQGLAVGPFMPCKQPGTECDDDQVVIFGILHVMTAVYR